MIDGIQKVAELVSNGLAVPVIAMSLIVAIFWYKPAMLILKNKNTFKSAESWFIVGVFFGFAGESLDNLYWTITWAMSYLDHPYTKDLQKYGVFANIPFRQILGIAAAYCHIRSAYVYIHKKEANKTTKFLMISIAGGVVFSVVLMLIKTLLVG